MNVMVLLVIENLNISQSLWDDEVDVPLEFLQLLMKRKIPNHIKKIRGYLEKHKVWEFAITLTTTTSLLETRLLGFKNPIYYWLF